MTFPAELFERKAELGQRAAIKVARGDKLVSRVHQREENQKLRGMSGGRGERGPAALEARHPLFEHRNSRIGQPRIDVPKLCRLKSEAAWSTSSNT
jgi:hypothetical protein